MCKNSAAQTIKHQPKTLSLDFLLQHSFEGFRVYGLGGSRKWNPQNGTLYYYWGISGIPEGGLISRFAQGSG